MSAMLFTITFYIGFIILLRFICKSHISAWLRYALWLLVAVKLLVFPMPDVEGRFSVLRLTEGLGSSAALEEEILEEVLEQYRLGGMAGGSQREEMPENGNLWGNNGQTEGKADIAGTDHGAEPEYAGEGGNGISGWERWRQIMKLRLHYYMENVLKVPVWLIIALGAGSAVCAFGMIVYHVRLNNYLKRKRRVLETENLYLSGEEKRRWGITEKKEELKEAADAGGGRPVVYAVEGLPTPCLFGKSIYIPERLAEDEELLPYVLQHEMCHYKHLDHIWGILRMVCVCLYWYHPLVWLAAYLSRQDCELACDEAVVRRMNGEERKCYGELLLASALVRGTPAECFSMTTAMSGSARNLKERLQRITGKRKVWKILGIGVIILGLAGICACIMSGSVGLDKQWQYIEIKEQDDSIPLIHGSYKAEYQLSEDAASVGLYIETYEYGELVSAEVLDCAALTAESGERGKTKKGEAVFSREVETDSESGACRKAVVSYSMPDPSASEGASSTFKAFTLELPENCMGNSFSFSRAGGADDRFKLNEDIVLTVDYYGDARGLSIPEGHILSAEKYMESAEDTLKNDRYVILTHLIVSDKGADALEKELEVLVRNKEEQAAGREIQNSTDSSGMKGDTASADSREGYSDTDLIEMAGHYYLQEHGFMPEHVEIDSENGDQVTLWLYDMNEFLNADNEIIGNANTRDWYTVDRITRRGENVLFEEIDLVQTGPLSKPWDKMPDEMTVTDVREQSVFSGLPAEPEGDAEKQIYLLGETERYSLYGAGDYGSMILKDGDIYTEIAVPFIVDGITMQVPEIQEADYDGDGGAELAVKLLWGEGTGVWEEMLWMLDNEAGTVKAYAYHNGALAGELLRKLSWEKEGGEKKILLDGQQISPILRDGGGMSFEELGINTSRVNYLFQDGKIRVRTLISCGSREDSVMPAYGDGCLEAEVLYRGNGKFSLGKTESADLKDIAEAAMEALDDFFVPVRIGMIAAAHNMETWSFSDEAGETMSMTVTVQEEGEDSYDYAELLLIRGEDGRWTVDEDITVEK